MLNGMGLEQATRTGKGIEVFDGATDKTIEQIVNAGDAFFSRMGNPNIGEFD